MQNYKANFFTFELYKKETNQINDFYDQVLFKLSVY